MDRKGFERIVAICACALLALAVASLFYLARDLVLPVFLAVFIALVLQPIVRRFCRLGMNRPAAAVATMLIVLAILFGGGYRLTAPAIDWLDRILAPLDRIAVVFMAALSVAVIVLALDREPPFVVLTVEPAYARPGQIVVIRASVQRDLTRQCSAEFTRYIFDSERTRWYLDSGQASPALIETLEVKSPGRLAVAFRVPDDAAPGVGSLEAVLDYRCNKVHYLWPIQVTTDLPFTVLPP